VPSECTLPEQSSNQRGREGHHSDGGIVETVGGTAPVGWQNAKALDGIMDNCIVPFEDDVLG
jgi:hypothetical protein